VSTDTAQVPGPVPEDFPSGRFGGPHITPCTPEEQAEHLAVLADEMSMVSVADLMRRQAARTQPPAARGISGSGHPPTQKGPAVLVRPDVAELLNAGYSDRAIARQLGVDAQKTVAPARAHLGLPKAKPGKKKGTTTPEDLFRARAQPTGDGHMQWTGFRVGGTPALRHGGKNITACRVAFKIRYGREPIGNVTNCGIDGCVNPDCVADRPMREASRTPAHKPGSRPRYASLQAALDAKTERLDDGHVRWRGYTDATSNTPLLFHAGQRIPAPKAAFILHHGRDPVGKPLPTCDMTGCIAGAHLADRPMREANQRADAAYEAIFGAALVTDDAEICGELAPQAAALLAAVAAGAEVITVRGRDRVVETAPTSIDNYPPTTAA
jgi:hypothetical protein